MCYTLVYFILLKHHHLPGTEIFIFFGLDRNSFYIIFLYIDIQQYWLLFSLFSLCFPIVYAHCSLLFVRRGECNDRRYLTLCFDTCLAHCLSALSVTLFTCFVLLHALFLSLLLPLFPSKTSSCVIHFYTSHSLHLVSSVQHV